MNGMIVIDPLVMPRRPDIMAGTGYCWGNGYLRGDGAGSNNISRPVKVGG